MPTMEAGLVDLTLSWCSKGGEMSPTEGGGVRVKARGLGLDGGTCGRCQRL